MSEFIFQNERFDHKDWVEQQLHNYEFEYCSFINCDFSNIAFIGCQFIECEFRYCNLSLTQMTDSVLNGVRFEESKLIGIKFNNCNNFIFEVSFNQCILDYSSFENRKMSKTKFNNCNLKGADFTQTDLKQATFNTCNLEEAIFSGCNLQKTDFTTSYNYVINLQDNFTKQTKFSKNGLHGLLKNYDIIIEDI